jgi:hypothetical protein
MKATNKMMVVAMMNSVRFIERLLSKGRAGGKRA